MAKSSLLRLIAFLTLLLAFKLAHSQDFSNQAKTANNLNSETFFNGIDVSHYQGSISWKRVKLAGIKFAFIKASQGSSQQDPSFARNWLTAKENKIIVGAYHYFVPGEEALEQAKNFIATVNLQKGDILPVVDIEQSGQLSRATLSKALQTWLDAVEAKYQVKPIIYSNFNFLTQNLSQDFSNYPLWLADYNLNQPSSPIGWAKWSFWQYSNSQTLPGVKGLVDKNIYRGDLANWKTLLINR